MQQKIEEAFFNQQELVKEQMREKEMAATTIDRSTPVDPQETGKLTLMSTMRRHVEEVFRSM